MIVGGMNYMEVPAWITRLMWRWKYRDCHKLAFRIAVLGQADDNGKAQAHLDKAKDELYAAANIFNDYSKE